MTAKLLQIAEKVNLNVVRPVVDEVQVKFIWRLLQTFQKVLQQMASFLRVDT